MTDGQLTRIEAKSELVDAYRDRAEKAEAKLADIRALCDDDGRVTDSMAGELAVTIREVYAILDRTETT